GPFPSVDAELAAWGRAVAAGEPARRELLEDKVKNAGWDADKLTEEQKRELWEAEQEALELAWAQERSRAEEARPAHGGAEAAAESDEAGAAAERARAQANRAHQELAHLLRQQGGSAGLLAE